MSEVATLGDVLKTLGCHPSLAQFPFDFITEFPSYEAYAHAYISEFIANTNHARTWFTARKNAPILVICEEAFDHDDWCSYPAVARFTGETLESLNRAEGTIILQFCCNCGSLHENGAWILSEIICQALTNDLCDFSVIHIPRRADSDKPFEYMQLEEMLEQVLSALLKQAPVVIAVDSVHRYEAPKEANVHVFTALSKLIELAQTNQERHPLKVVITSVNDLGFLQKPEGIAKIVRVPEEERQKAWEIGEQHANEKQYASEDEEEGE
ncbi:uncharacterized protein LTR77_007295 [Saxophila tyrrhenica]|uniref:Uncharacterized protein n=1 Tax=Saxophila tyrrhenica TaxID=1690608 RepID=A0AAV9P4D4_9PEZI|nr:hypothetical protein LTR77_007295 [Saxophila tyrrhenica]